MLRFSLLITVGLAVVLGVIYFSQRRSAPVLVFSPAVKVCQLTGEFDKQRNQPTRNFQRQFGVTGTDYGYPVPWNDKLLFLFGDTRSIDTDDFDAGHAREEIEKGYDSVASGPLHADVQRAGCVDLEFITEAPKRFRPLRLRETAAGSGVAQPPRPLGVLETPVSGFAGDDELFAFFSVRDKRPGCGRKDGCALLDEDQETGGQAKLARADGNGTDFSEVTVVSREKFQWPVAVVEDIKNLPGLPAQVAGVNLTGRVVLIWGAGRENYYFRRGYPFLAVVPLSEVGNMGAWRYLQGLSPSGQPNFVFGEENAKPLPPFGNERPTEPNQPPYHSCIGEFSVGFVTALEKWVMLYACDNNRTAGFNPNNGNGIYVRTAAAPWGPWSKPEQVFDPKQGYCMFMHELLGCSSNQPNPRDLERVNRNRDFEPLKTPAGDWDLLRGGWYAPFLIPTYTSVRGDKTDLYFAMSTWNPYQVVLMRTSVRTLRSFLFADLRSALQRGWDLLRGRR